MGALPLARRTDVISYAVMHAPWSGRGPYVAELLAALPGAQLVTDDWRQGVWPTARRAWSAHHAHATHHVVVQDDAVLPSDFLERVEELTTRSQSTVYAFNRTRGGITAVAMMMPRPAIPVWLAWTDTLPPQRRKHDDEMLVSWCRNTRTELRVLDIVGHRPVGSIARS